MSDPMGNPSADGLLVGGSTALSEQLRSLDEIAQSDATILITGETGTGKDILARTLHQRSNRRGNLFVVQNCAATTETLLQSTLFGHRKGAFTGARDQIGTLERASGGTLFLDEIGEMSPSLQAMLLRFLETGEIARIGETLPRRVDVRIISATNRDLWADCRAGIFREDLYYRLVTFEIEMPALRDREGDVPLLAEHFLRRFNQKHDKNLLGFAPETIQALERYHWPGNVRQLSSQIERACILTPPGELIQVGVLSREVREVEPRGTDGPRSLPEALAELEQRLLREALQRCDGNRSQAARDLGISRQRLNHRLCKWGIR